MSKNKLCSSFNHVCSGSAGDMHVNLNGNQAHKVLKVHRIKCCMNVCLNVACSLMCFEWPVRIEKHYGNANPFAFPFGHHAKSACPHTSLRDVLKTTLWHFIVNQRCFASLACLSGTASPRRFNMLKWSNNC